MRAFMQGRVTVVTVAVSSLLWFASGAAYAAFVWTGFGPAVGLVFPETIAAGRWQSPSPWNIVLPLFEVAVFAAVFTLILVAVRRAAAPTFVVVWFAAILASALTAAFVAVAGIAAMWPPARLLIAVETVRDPLASGGYWGLLWGWAPATVAVALVRRSGSRKRAAEPAPAVRRSVTRPAISSALLAVLATAGLAIAMNAYLSEQVQGEAPAPIVQPQPKYTPPPQALVAAGQFVIDPSWCRSDQLTLLDGGGDAATGHRMLTIVATNTSDAACVLADYPDLSFRNDETGDLGVNVFRGGSFMTEDAGAEPLTLQPGQHVTSAIGWNANSTAGGGETNTLYAAPYAGAQRQPIPVELDVVAGSTVAVTAWQPPTG